MTDTNLVMEGVNLMFLGMGIVFSFLVALVFALKVMSWLAQQLAPDPAPIPISVATTTSLESETDEALLAVVAAAVARFRKNHQ